MSARQIWLPELRLWQIGLLAAPAASACAVLLAGNSTTGLLVAALLSSLLLTVLPFRWLMTLLIITSGFTSVQIAGLGVNLRLDIALVPAALISCALSNRLAAFAHWMQHPVLRLLSGYVALQFVISWLASPLPAKSLSIATWLLLNLIIVALALACFGDDRRALMLRLAITGALVVASGLAAWVGSRYLGVTWGAGFDPSFGIRPFGIALEPNILAATGAMWAVILLTRSGRRRARDWLFVVLCLLLIPLTNTRAAAIAVVAGLAVYFAGELRKIPRVVAVLAAMIICVVMIQLVAPNTVSSTIQKLTNFSDSTAIYRTNNWQLALQDMHGLNWLFGLGTNSFGQRHIDPTHLLQQAPDYLGNLPLQTVYDSGLLGLSLLLGSAVLMVRAGHSVRRLALLVTFLVVSTATSPFFFANWWLFIALGLARRKEAVDSPEIRQSLQMSSTLARDGRSREAELSPTLR